VSGLAGIFSLDGRPADEGLLLRMTAAIAHRGPDGITHMVDDTVALGHCMLKTTGESLRERQPLWDGSQSCCLAMDGRVDNREELTHALESARFPLREDTDAELVLASYLTWGDSCPRRITGDFAFVIHDRPNRRLFCARDPLGVKPFYYWTDGKVFLWASELLQLFQHAGVRKEPNEGMVAECLAGRIASLDETLYAGIMRLPPAHLLSVTRRRLDRRRYWDANPNEPPRASTLEENAEAFRAVFEEAVRCRLRSHRPVGAELNGGISSSSIVGVAQSLLRRGVANDEGFEAFSRIFPGEPRDESDFIDAVAGLWGMRTNRFIPDEKEWREESARRHQDLPDHPIDHMAVPIYEELERRGFRTYLTADGGNDWLDRSCEVTWRDRALSTLARRPMFRGIVRLAHRRKSRREWIPRELARRVGLADRLAPPAEVRWRLRSIPQRRHHALLTDGLRVHTLEMTDRLAARFGVEPRHPFNDRRVVELALSLPDAFHCDDGRGKVLLRAAMSKLLPPIVRERRTDVDFSRVFAASPEQAAAAFAAPATARRGWIDAEAFRRTCGKGCDNPWPLWFALGVEAWYRANLGSGVDS
jgi:asparagine synthase (glutamine-hydrolysing)